MGCDSVEMIRYFAPERIINKARRTTLHTGLAGWLASYIQEVFMRDRDRLYNAGEIESGHERGQQTDIT